jgi:hypothetical protein
MKLGNFEINNIVAKNMEELDYINLGKCFEKILIEIDHNNWNKFREDFVLTLVEFGYIDYLYEDERRWYDDYLADDNKNYLGIDDYTW